MRWTNKAAIPLAPYSVTTTSSIFNLEPSDISNGFYIIIRPTVAAASWNCNVQMAPLATGVYAEVANLDNCCADLNTKAIFIASSTIITKLPRVKIEFEQGAAAEVTAEVYLMSAID